MFYAYGFDQVGVVLSDLYFVDPNPRAGQEGHELGARLEVHLFDRTHFHGWEPDVRTFEPELSADPITWVAQRLADAGDPPRHRQRSL